MEIKISSRFSPRKAVYAKQGGKIRTQQQFKEECDINNIMRKYQEKGILPDLIKTNPRYGDFSEAPTYLEAMETIFIAQKQFAALPAKVRDRFQNDPAQFLEFVHNPENENEMVKLGLATAKPINENGVPAPKQDEPAAPKGDQGASK